MRGRSSSRRSADIVPESRGVIAAIAEVLRGCPGADFEIGGHTNSQGSAAANPRLSDRRAQAVLAALRRGPAGGGADRPRIRGRRAAADNASEAGGRRTGGSSSGCCPGGTDTGGDGPAEAAEADPAERGLAGRGLGRDRRGARRAARSSSPAAGALAADSSEVIGEIGAVLGGCPGTRLRDRRLHQFAGVGQRQPAPEPGAGGRGAGGAARPGWRLWGRRRAATAKRTRSPTTPPPTGGRRTGGSPSRRAAVGGRGLVGEARRAAPRGGVTVGGRRRAGVPAWARRRRAGDPVRPPAPPSSPPRAADVPMSRGGAPAPARTSRWRSAGTPIGRLGARQRAAQPSGGPRRCWRRPRAGSGAAGHGRRAATARAGRSGTTPPSRDGREPADRLQRRAAGEEGEGRWRRTAMDRSELTMAVAGALVGAFLLGWIFRWVFGRMNVHGPHGASHADMASELHAAEEARHRVELRRPRWRRRRRGGWPSWTPSWR